MWERGKGEGRPGEGEAQHQRQSRGSRLKSDYRKQKESNAAERKAFLDNIKVAVDRRIARIALLDEKIAELEKAND